MHAFSARSHTHQTNYDERIAELKPTIYLAGFVAVISLVALAILLAAPILPACLVDATNRLFENKKQASSIAIFTTSVALFGIYAIKNPNVNGKGGVFVSSDVGEEER